MVAHPVPLDQRVMATIALLQRRMAIVEGIINDPVAIGSTLARSSITSTNYVSGSSGWTLNTDGSGEITSDVTLDIGGTIVTIGPTVPPSPIGGQFWFDTSSGTPVMKVYNAGTSSFVLYQFGTDAIANNAVTQALLSNNAVGTAQIIAAAVGTAELAAAAVTTSNIANNAVTATQIAANTITAGQIAASTITAGQIAAATITGSLIAASTITGSLIAGGTVAAANLVAGIVVAGIVNSTTISTATLTSSTINSTSISGGTITGTQIVADGSSGEVLIYSSTPASGNLVGSWSANSGSDGFSNAYNAGLWVYDTTGNEIGLVPGGSTSSMLALASGSSTPSPPSGCAAVYGTSAGGVSVVDNGDGQAYATQRRSIVSNGGPTIGTSVTGLFSTAISVRDYRIHAVLYVTAGATQTWGWDFQGPGSMAGTIGVLAVSGGSVLAATNIPVNNSSFRTGSINNGTTVVIFIDGAINVASAGTFTLSMVVSTGTASVAQYSSFDIMPV